MASKLDPRIQAMEEVSSRKRVANARIEIEEHIMDESNDTNMTREEATELYQGLIDFLEPLIGNLKKNDPKPEDLKPEDTRAVKTSRDKVIRKVRIDKFVTLEYGTTGQPIRILFRGNRIGFINADTKGTLCLWSFTIGHSEKWIDPKEILKYTSSYYQSYFATFEEAKNEALAYIQAHGQVYKKKK